MPGKDLAEKTLEMYNDVFVDVVNGLLFDGKQIVKEDALTDATTISMYKVDKELHEQDRDVAKYWIGNGGSKASIRIAFLGIENQTDYDKDMPLRVIGYDGAAYRNQLNENLKDKCYPVITLVLYFGTKRRWKKYKSLKEIMNIPKELDAYITDYKINIFELAWLTDEQIDSFTSDFRYVAILLRRLRTGRPYPMTDTKYKHAREIIDLFRVMSQNNKEIGIILDDIKNERNHTGGAHMTVEEMDEMINRFENRGAEKQAVEAAKNFYTNGVSIDVISKSLNMTPEQVKEIVKDVVVLQA